jgi:hypothetical protein
MNKVSEAQFTLLRHSLIVAVLTRTFVAMALVATGVNLGLFAAHKIPGETALILGLVFVLMPAAGIWNARLMGKGTAELHSDHLLIRTRASKNRYRWADIVEVRLTTLAEQGTLARFIARFWGMDPRQPFIELRLRRTLRAGFWPGQYGTDMSGISTLSGKRQWLHVTDPEEFVHAASRLLGT